MQTFTNVVGKMAWLGPGWSSAWSLLYQPREPNFVLIWTSNISQINRFAYVLSYIVYRIWNASGWKKHDIFSLGQAMHKSHALLQLGLVIVTINDFDDKRNRNYLHDD